MSPIALLQNLPKDGAAARVLEMGSRRVQVLTLGNVVVPLWLPYIVERPTSLDTKPGVRRRKPYNDVSKSGQPSQALAAKRTYGSLQRSQAYSEVTSE